MFPLASFLHVLEGDGFRLTVRDYDRIALVLATDGDWTLARLRSVLCALLARNEDQQDLFARRFDEFFTDFPDALPFTAAVDFDIVSKELGQLRSGRHRGLPLQHLSKTGSVFFGKPLTEKKHPWFQIGLSFCALLIVLAVFFWPAPQYEQDVPLEAQSTAEEVVEPKAETDLNSLPRYVVQPRRPVIASRESTLVAGNDAWQQTAAIAAVLFFLCLAYALYLYRAQKVPKDKPAPWKDDPALPRLFPLDRVGGKPAPRLDRETLSHLADCLGYFQGDLPGREPDILRSVAATAEHAGLPILVFPKKKQLRRLIILVNHTDSEALRLNPVAEELRVGMAGLGVQLLCGRYYDDPAVFFLEDGRPRFLVDYESGRNGYLLLIFSSHGELDRERHGQTVEELARWPHIAWMQLRTDRFQQNSTVTACYGIASYPASKAGLLAAFTRFLTETGSRQETGSGVRQIAPLRGDTDVHILVEIRLANALPWAQACSMLQPIPLGLADCLRREFFSHLPPERIERFMDLPGTSLGKGGFSFSRSVQEALQQGFFTRFEEARQRAILQRILAALEETRDKELGECTGHEATLAHLAWQKHYQLVNLQLEPEQALKGLVELEGTPLEATLKADLEKVNPAFLCARVGNSKDSKDSLQRIARLFGKKSGLSLLKRYPLSWLQWAGAAVLVLSLLIASGLSVQGWLGAGQGEVRLSVLTEQGGGNGWVGVEGFGITPEKRSSTEGLLRLPVETRLPLRKKWQLVFYDHALQPAHTLEIGRISENQLVRLDYEEAVELIETGELVVTDKQRNVLRDAEVTLRSALFTSTARADRTLVLPVGEYEVQVENSSGIRLGWQRITVNAGEKEVVELELNRFREPLTGMEFVTVPAGCFQMGSSPEEKNSYENEVPVHKVCVDGFGMGQYEVTQGQWQKIMGENPAKFQEGDNYPVERVSWDDVQKFIRKLNKKSGKEYRLPTEAEWEYAARAKSSYKYSGGDDLDTVAWYDGNSNHISHPVGQKKVNDFGLHDMSGNVWEWCADWYDGKYYASSPQDNPVGPLSGSLRVIRGGGWDNYPRSVRSAYRGRGTPGSRYDGLGFRLALSVQQGR